MSTVSADERVSKEQAMRDLAQQLMDISTTKAGAVCQESILNFAGEAESYADQIRDAPSDGAASEVVAEALRHQSQWMESLEPLTVAIQEDLRRTSTQLRAVADNGTSAVFQAIGAIASEADTALTDVLAAETTMQKLLVYVNVEKSRAGWLSQMEELHSAVADGNESQAPTEAPDASALSDACESEFDFLEDSSCVPSKEPVSGNGCISTFTGGGYSIGSGCSGVAGAGWQSRVAGSGYNTYFPSSSGCTVLSSAASEAVSNPSAPPVASEADVSSPSETAASSSGGNSTATKEVLDLSSLTPEDARAQLKTYLNDKDEGLLATLRGAVVKVKEDSRFEGVHEEAGKLLEQMELAAGAIIPEALVQEFSEDVSGAEDKLKATVEPMRKAQWGGFYAKQAAMKVRKYDLYIAKGKMPKLKDEHAELLECAQVCVALAEFLRKEAQNAIMDSVTGLVKQAMSSS